MRLLFTPAAAARRLSTGIILGGSAVLRLWAAHFLMTPGGFGAAVIKRRPKSSEGAFYSDRSASPSLRGGLAERAGAVRLLPAFCLLFLALLVAPLAARAESVVNTAKAGYKVGVVPLVTDSNQVSTTIRTPSKLEFLSYAPLSPTAELVPVVPTSYLSSGGGYLPSPPPVRLGSPTPIDLSAPVPLVVTTVYHENEPFFLRLTDLDQNLDPAVAETVVVTISLPETGESETLRLTETGPNTGVFTGYVQSSSTGGGAGNGIFTVKQNAPIRGVYTDIIDGTDSSAAAALVDPYGIVFNTLTGLPVSGAMVSMIDAATGLPATIYGDDGISLYPASVVSGATATDSSGQVYTFPPGFYRFPYMQPGRYLLKVTPPPNYLAPSTVSTADIQDLPGAPYAIVSPGSRSEEFVINPGPAIHIDLPVDPLLYWLHVTKSASKATVAIGDFLQYRLAVENTGTAAVNGVAVSDRLPSGFRYRQGSAKLDGNSAADPAISADGRTLLFPVGTLAATKTTVVTYVVEVAVGAPLGKAINTAFATGTRVMPSNTARAEVLVKEDFFTSKSTVVGRVFPRGCPNKEADAEGVAGVRIYLEDGTYVVTDINGMYHFEGLQPGTHVVQLDLETVPKDYELVTCEENSRFAQTPFSQFVDLQGGTMWRADFYAKLKPVVPPEPPVKINGSVGIELTSGLAKGATDADEVAYRLTLLVGEVPVINQRLMVMLPDGVTYQAGSSVLNGATLADPEVMEGALTYRLGNAEAGWAGNLGFTGEIAADLKDGELTTKAMLTFNTSDEKNRRTPLVENILEKSSREERVGNPEMTLRPRFEVLGYTLSANDKTVLDGIIAGLQGQTVTHLSVTGHTDSTPIAARNRHIMADNYALSKARAASVAEYLQAGLNLQPEQMTIDGKGPDEPLVSNKTAEERAMNRRVELQITSEKTNRYTALKVTKENSGTKSVGVIVEKAPEISAEEQARYERLVARTLPEFNSNWLDKAQPGLAFVWPYVGYYPAIPSTKIGVKHDPQKKLTLLLNGKEVDPLYLDGVSKRGDNQLAVSLWIGVHLSDGDNLFEAVESSDDGREESRVACTLHYSTSPVKAEIVPGLSRLIADGKTPSVVAIRLTDKDGHPAREGLVGEFQLDAPYLAMQQLQDLQENPLLLATSARLKYLVGEDGIARIELQPTTRTGEVTLRFTLADAESELRTWLSGGEREWIVVGFGEGTAGYSTLAGNMENLGAAQADDKYYQDDRLAFFAKGMIKGEWLLTIAYDSAKAGMRQAGSLYGTIDPQKYYTLYGDASAQQYEAASARQLYLKIERDQFYALFGDYDTGLSVTELSRYNRNFNGLKSEMKGDKYDYKLFVSDTNQAFVKDELRGDGTSGLYRLSRNNIVINSETITIESRDRYKSEVIVSSQVMNRHIDYDIDYEAGTIFFKSPIFSRDENFNPIYIVIDYESADAGDMSFNYGGRGAVRFMDKRVEIGSTHIHEGRVGGEGNLYGVDTTVKINENTTLKAELAATDNEFGGNGADGTAYLAEVSQQTKNAGGKVYLREQDGDFGLGQQMGSETGTRKIGLDGNYRWTEQVTVLTSAFRQYNLGTDAVRDMAELRTNLSEKGYALHGGLRHAQDNMGNGETNTSEQFISGVSFNLLEDQLVLRAEHDQSLLGQNSNGDFPTRTLIGADYKLTEKATLFIAEEFSEGKNESTEMTRLGLRSSLWSGGQLSSSLEQQATENGTRVFSVSGLKQAWQISKQWSVDAGLDRSSTIKEPGNTPINTNVPAAAGNSDFTAISSGAAYREEKWSWTGRVEWRTSDTEDKFGLFTGLYGEVKEGLGLGGAAQIFRTAGATGNRGTSGDLRLSLAYRPKASAWIILDRLDYLFDRQTGGALAYDNWRVINNVNVNWKIDQKTQLSLQYGAKYVNETIDDCDYSGYTDLSGLEGRYDLTKKWDVGLTGKVLHSWAAKQMQYGSGASLGYNLVKNAWISVGYNFLGFKDRDFSAADFTAQGPFIKFRFKFDQASVREAVQAF